MVKCRIGFPTALLAQITGEGSPKELNTQRKDRGPSIGSTSLCKSRPMIGRAQPSWHQAWLGEAGKDWDKSKFSQVAVDITRLPQHSINQLSTLSLKFFSMLSNRRSLEALLNLKSNDHRNMHSQADSNHSKMLQLWLMNAEECRHCLGQATDIMLNVRHMLFLAPRSSKLNLWIARPLVSGLNACPWQNPKSWLSPHQ